MRILINIASALFVFGLCYVLFVRSRSFIEDGSGSNPVHQKKVFTYKSYVPRHMLPETVNEEEKQDPLLTRERIIEASKQLASYVAEISPQTPFERQFRDMFLTREDHLSPIEAGISVVNYKYWTEDDRYIGEIKPSQDCHGRRLWYGGVNRSVVERTQVLSKNNPKKSFDKFTYLGSSVYFCESARMSDTVLSIQMYGMLHHFIPPGEKVVWSYFSEDNRARLCSWYGYAQMDLTVIVYRWEAMVRMSHYLLSLGVTEKRFSTEDYKFLQQLRQAQKSLVAENFSLLPPPKEFSLGNGKEPHQRWWFVERCEQFYFFDNPEEKK